MVQFNSMGFSTYKRSGQESQFLRWCRGGNFETGCHQNLRVTTDMIVDEAITAAKADPDDIVLTILNQNIGGTKRFLETLQVDEDIEVRGRVVEGPGLLVPPGVILSFAGSSAPAGYLACDGSNVSRVVYSDLFDVIGVTYGSGNGSTTFTLPNLAGRVPTGVDGATFASVGDTGGAETTTLTVDELPSHAHAGTTDANGVHIHDASTASAGTHTHTTNAIGGQGNPGLAIADGTNTATDTDSSTGELNVWTTASALTVNSAGAHTHDVTVNSNGSHTHDFTTETTGNGQAFSNLAPYLTTLYIIKF